MASGRIIVLKGNPIVKEGKAGAAGILPGHRLSLVGAPLLGDVVVAGAADEDDPGRKAFAVEADVIGNDATQVYADNDQVKYVVAGPGDELNARAVVSLTWVIGAPLYAAAAGQITDMPGTTGVAFAPIGYALSSVTTSTANQLVPIEVA